MFRLRPVAGRPAPEPVAFDRTLLDSTSEGCWVVDRDLRTTYVNRALCALLGYREHELQGSHLLSFVAEESRPTLERQVALRDLEAQRSYDVTLRRSDGVHVYTIFNASTIPGADGRANGACIFVTDITRRRTAEVAQELKHEQLEETVERINRFVGLICHDLKDPLSALLGLTQLINDGRPDAGRPDLSGYVDLCNDAGRQLMRTIEDLSLWSRLQLNQFTFDLREYDLSGLLDDVLEQAAAQADRRGVRITNRIQGRRVLCDLTATALVLRHLIDNAIRFSPAGNEVRLDCLTEGRLAVVSVRDQGVGIPLNVQPLLFRIDHRHAAQDLDGEVGGGLGLVICRMLVERMGGVIALDSRPGAGTEVRFSLPLAGRSGAAK